MLDAPTPTTDSRIAALLLHHEIDQFNVRYAAALDAQRLTEWTEMFTEDAFYLVTSRENADRNLPVGLIYCEGRGMIRDRAFALDKTAMFARRRTTSCCRCCSTARMRRCTRSACTTMCFIVPMTD